MKIKFTILKTVLALTCYFTFSLTLLAQDGSLDLSFDTDGIVTTQIGVSARATSVTIQSDGKILVAGSTENGVDADFALVRYNPDGSLDNTFGTAGTVTTPIGTGDDSGTSLALQSDGKIVVAGYGLGATNNDILIVRYNTDGSLDNTFDTDGMVTTSIGGSDYSNSLVIQTDGKIVVAGGSFTGVSTDFAVVRYNTNGSLDNTFDTDGKVTTPVGTGNDNGYSLALQNDGKIVVAGVRFSTTASSDIALIRYNTNGSLDNTFDLDGKVTTSFGAGDDHAYSVVIQSDGKIVVGGDSIGAFALARYNTDGSLDNTYDTDGIVVTSIGASNGLINSIALQPDGKIVATGYTFDGSHYVYALARYNTNGSLDNTFDTDGMVTTPIGTGNSFAYNIAIQADGKIVVAGYGKDGSQDVFGIARYNNTITSGISNYDLSIEKLNIFPNPFSEQTTIETGIVLNNAVLTVYNSLGEQVKQIMSINGQIITLRRDNLPIGLYYVLLTQENKTIAIEKLTITD